MKYISISICTLLIIGLGLLGYFLHGFWGCTLGITFALIIVIAAYVLLSRRFPALYARLSRNNIHSDYYYATGITAAQNGSDTSSTHEQLSPRARLGLLAHAARLDEQNARHVKRFWCYRNEHQTLFFVRMRSGKLYCFYMRRATRGEGARWIIHKIEGCEYGDIAAQALKLMDDYHRQIHSDKRDNFSHDIATHGVR